MRPAAAIFACLALAACGSDSEDDAEGGRACPGPQGASLTVSVQPKGPDGPTERRRIVCERLGEGNATCRSLGELTVKRLAPVPATVACAEIYGGPDTARVTGELRGEKVDARFNRTDACETKRWNDNAALLDP